jgi:hypothetical protein
VRDKFKITDTMLSLCVVLAFIVSSRILVLGSDSDCVPQIHRVGWTVGPRFEGDMSNKHVTAPGPDTPRRPHFDAFERTLSDDHSLIISRCYRCGAILIGSVSNGLPLREAEHAAACTKKKVAHAARAA